MSFSSLAPVRRIVTGLTGAGRSCIVEDGASPAILTIEGLPGFRNNSLWRTLGGDQSVNAPDSVVEHEGALPPASGGTIFRVVDIPPEGSDADEQGRKTQDFFKSVLSDADLREGSVRHPTMHRTNTIDYCILVSGELVAILDKDETVMRTGDILIQRGTNHAFANRSTQIARLACVLVDAGR